MRIIDAIGNNESQFEQLDFLISRFEKLLRKDDYYRLLNINQCARLFKVMAQASHKTLNYFPLLDHLTRTIHKGIDSLRENDVISILKAYQYLQRDIKFSQKLLNDLNATVVATAIENKDQVSAGFLINYMQQFFLISQRGISQQRDLTKEQREQMVGLLQEKLSANKSGTVPYNQIEGLAQILIRNPKSETIREVLIASISKNVRRLNFEELHSTLYAIRNSFNIDKDAKFQTQQK